MYGGRVVDQSLPLHLKYLTQQCAVAEAGRMITNALGKRFLYVFNALFV